MCSGSLVLICPFVYLFHLQNLQKILMKLYCGADLILVCIEGSSELLCCVVWQKVPAYWRSSSANVQSQRSYTSASPVCLYGVDWDFTYLSGGTHHLHIHGVLQNVGIHLPNYMALQPPTFFILAGVRTCNLKQNSVIPNMAPCKRNLYVIDQLIDWLINQLTVQSFLCFCVCIYEGHTESHEQQFFVK